MVACKGGFLKANDRTPPVSGVRLLRRPMLGGALVLLSLVPQRSLPSQEFWNLKNTFMFHVHGLEDSVLKY